MTTNNVFAQSTSNKGRDFWLGYGNHVRGYDNNTQRMVVYITSDVSTSGRLEIPGIGHSATYSVTANSITTVEIPQSAYLRQEGLSNQAIHITAERPVVVYAHIYNQNVSGATLVLPTPALGKEYYSINYTQISNQTNSFSYFFVIAVEDNTQVEITPAAETHGHPAGVPFIVNLNKGQIYQVLGKSTYISPLGSSMGVDLTGSTIRSITTTAEPCKRIAVFSGSGKIAIGCGEDGTGSSDNLYQQVYPTKSWGRKFITAPLKSRDYDIIRILKSDPTAVVKLNGRTVPNAEFVNNFYYEFDSQSPNVVESDKPIQVVQYAVTQRRSISCNFIAEEAGDPEMIFLNSVEQNIDNITVYSSAAYLIVSHFINVIIETGAASSFRLDGAPVSFRPISGDPAYSYAQLTVNAGVHNLRADKGFNAIAYGFGSAESYGYSAGANVKSLGIELETRVKNVITTTGCINEPLKFRVSLPYAATKLIWNLEDGGPARSVSSPVPARTYIENDLTYNVYELSDTIRYARANEYTVNVIAEKTLGDGCGSSEQLFFDFSIFNPPVPEFKGTLDVCAGDSVLFTDESNGQGRPITTWLWDFGDSLSTDNTSTLQNPVHIFSEGGTYKVKLTVTNESNCEPVVLVKELVILSRPKAVFEIAPDICETKPVLFTDRSIVTQGEINKWNWDFGDGQTSNEKNPSHTYLKAGTYTVTLTSGGDKSCTSDPVTQTIQVSSLPIVDFELPEVCLADSRAQFLDKSIIPGDTTQAKYLWNFGDPNATVENNTSSIKNASHKYTAAGNYPVTLTIISANGCQVELSKTLRVNGSIPKAEFVVIDADKLCSSKPVIVEDRASVDFGELTRIVWIFDLDNEPETIVVDENPNLRGESFKHYEHQYPVFNSPAEKTYRVKMLAFSGEVCISEQVREIVLKAEPEIAFDSIPAVCGDVAPFQLTQGRLINGIAGQGVYSGPGISPDGTFNPGVAGAGTHTLTYTFTGLNSCTDFKTQTVTVIGLPDATAGEDLRVLEGGEIRLGAQATGDSLIYKWTPSTGLDRDDVLNPIASPVEDITYTLTVAARGSCTVTDEVLVKVLKMPVIPNAFTPNSDGVNDEWNIKYLESYPDVTVEVFNRFGNKVYSSVGYTESWKGQFNGDDLPVGTYYYIINPKNGRETISGAVTILR
ncbi:PKD domain-containing protein [Flavihumibacter sp. R14]|nr:PKD domain-containing protein [Flavihumibacter soli]